MKSIMINLAHICILIENKILGFRIQKQFFMIKMNIMMMKMRKDMKRKTIW
jgi:hypothetical protein